MARPLTLLLVFFLCFNLFAGVLLSTGAAATLGIDANVGEDGEREELVNDTAGDGSDEGGLPTGSPSSGTLFGLYNVVGGFISGLFSFVFPGLRMLGRAGVPSWLTNMIGTVFSVLITIDVAAFVRGYQL